MPNTVHEQCCGHKERDEDDGDGDVGFHGQRGKGRRR